MYDFSSAFRAFFITVGIGVLLLILIAFFLGRCSANTNVKFQSPVVVQPSSTKG